MNFKAGFCSIIATSLTATTVTCSAQSPANDSSPKPGSIKWYAQKAQQQGSPSITILAPQGMFEKVTSLDQALSIYHVVIATPIASVTQILDSFHVYTWYKLQVLETLVPHPNPEVPAISIPDALLPIKSNEIVIHVPQGTVKVDGIRVTATDPNSQLLTLQSNYLLFLSPDSSGKFAFLRAGPDAIFLIKSDNRFGPLVDKQSRMQNDVEASTGGVLDSLRTLAKTKIADRPL